MAYNSSGEELIMKMRKQYTITKQRERWTEEEHNKFLKALKLYGRAWQKIKEHIGTKTAVQIRSHAQKFFSKLEKEAVMKGVPLGQAYDIEVPPPRPKRKPCIPYPRKSSVGSICPSGQAIDEKPTKSGSSLCTTKQVFDTESNVPQERRTKEDSEDGTCSEVVNLFQDAPSASISSANNASSDPRIHRGFVPVDKEMKEIAADTGTGGLQGMNSQTKPAQIETEDPSMNPLASATTEVPSYSEMSSIHQSFPVFPPVALFDGNQDVHRSFNNISSSLSSLIMTTLLQNPAVHAAASLAARFWPSADMAAPVSEIQESQCNPSPSLATVAAATVAAASAWWATQGLLPLFPLQPAFAYAPVPTTAIPIMDIAEAPKDHQIENPDQSDAPRAAPPSSKSPISTTSSSESNKSKRCDVSHEPKASKIDEFKPASDTGCDNSDQARSNKPDRSSCGSNTASSSEAKCEAKQIHCNYPPAGESNNRRFRICGSMNDSWKEVSEEGRIAFRALFNRGVLPQSFSPPQTRDAMANISKDKQATASQVDISKMRSDADTGQLKARRTGFKPYKRFSVEAKESRETASEEGGIKRMRLETEAST